MREAHLIPSLSLGINFYSFSILFILTVILIALGIIYSPSTWSHGSAFLGTTTGKSFQPLTSVVCIPDD